LKDIENPEKKPLTPEEIAEQKKRLQEKLKQVRAAKAKAEAEVDWMCYLLCLTVTLGRNRAREEQAQVRARADWSQENVGSKNSRTW
jgi:hypothetical protein